MTPLEKDIEKALTRGVGKLGGMCMKWVSPGWAGVPDRIVLMPGGRVYFAELKRSEGANVDSLQYEWHKRLHKLGMKAFFVRNQEEVKSFLKVISQDDAEDKMHFIRKRLPPGDAWGQLAEECCELSQAALKMQRCYSDVNKPRKTFPECLDGVLEEYADVQLCLSVLGVEPSDKSDDITRKKLERWVDILGYHKL